MPGPGSRRCPVTGRVRAREGGRGPGRVPQPLAAARSGVVGGPPSPSRRPRRISPCAGSGALPFGAGGASAREGEMGGRQGGLRLRAAALCPDTRTACPERGLGRSAEPKGRVEPGGRAPARWNRGLPRASFPPGRTQEPAGGVALLSALLGQSRWGAWPL